MLDPFPKHDSLHSRSCQAVLRCQLDVPPGCIMGCGQSSCSQLGVVLYKEVRAQVYTLDSRADEFDTVAALISDNMLKERYDAVWQICLSSQDHARQKELACAYTRHGLPGQLVCTPRPSSGWLCQTYMCKTRPF